MLLLAQLFGKSPGIGFGGDKVNSRWAFTDETDGMKDERVGRPDDQSGAEDDGIDVEVVPAMPIGVLAADLGIHRAAFAGVDNLEGPAILLMHREQEIIKREDLRSVDLAARPQKNHILIDSHKVLAESFKVLHVLTPVRTHCARL